MRDIKVIVIIILFSLTILLGSCSEDLPEGYSTNDSYLKIESDILNFSDDVCGTTITIESKGVWNMTKKPVWLDVEPTTGSGTCILSVKVIDYPQSDNIVFDTIYFQLDNIISKIQVHRAPYKFVVSPTTDFSFGAQDDNRNEFYIHCNTTWNIKKDYSWCHISDQSGKGDKTIFIYCDKNSTSQVRRDTLQIRTNLDTVYIPVYQGNSNFYINPTTPKLEFDVEGGAQSFTVDSNIEWSPVLLYGSIGSLMRNSNILTLTANKNATAEDKYDTILIKSMNTDEDVIALVPIHQKGLDPRFEIKPDSLTTKSLFFTNQGGDISFSIYSNLNWSVKSSDDSWCHVISEITGSGDGNIKINVDKNPVEAPERNCSITIHTSLGDKMISVRQDKGNPGYVRVNSDILEANPQGEMLTINIESNLASWNLLSNQNWCIVQTPTGSLDGAVKISVEMNSGDVARDAIITIKSAIRDVTINVHQEPKAIPGGGDIPNPYYSNKR